MKKIIKNLFLVIMLTIMTIVSVNAETNNNNGTITISNAVSGKTYTAYQILKLESYNKTTGAYSYTVANGWSNFFNGAGKDYVTITNGYVTWKASTDDVTVANFAKLALEYAKNNNITGTSITATSKKVEFTGLNLGYYLVDSSLGALCGLNTTNPSAEIQEKNSETTVDKKIIENNTPVSENDASIGDTIYYETTITVGTGAEKYVLYDKMEEGLTLNVDSIKVYLNNTEVASANNYTISTTTTGYTFVITFEETFTKALKTNDKIVVRYSAVLNEKAEISTDSNDNTTYLTYGDNNKTEEITTKTYTYEFDLVKTKSDNTLLDGAEFELKDLDGNKISLVRLENGNYRVAMVNDNNITTTIVVNGGVVTISGLKDGTYFLEETKAPDGYNKLSSEISVVISGSNLEATITNDAWTSGGIQVVNTTGSILPSTGGIGTTLFITIGSLLVIGFGVLLVTKLRLAKSM